jgi:hypothetical protein
MALVLTRVHTLLLKDVKRQKYYFLGGDSSHVNQAYDKYVTKGDKATSIETLSTLRRLKINKGIADQWALIHVGLACIKQTKPETWIASYSTRRHAEYSCVLRVGEKQPEHLDRGVPDAAVIKTAIELPEVVQDAIDNTTRVTEGLDIYTLKPKALKGIALFDHMVKLRMRSSKQPFLPSVHLDVHVYKNTGQHILFNPTLLDLLVRELMKDAGGVGATLRTAQRKLDNFGYIKSHSGLANDPERLERMRNQVDLTASFADIHNVQARDDQQKKKAEQRGLLDLVRAAIVKFNAKGRDATKLNSQQRNSCSVVGVLLCRHGAFAFCLR